MADNDLVIVLKHYDLSIFKVIAIYNVWFTIIVRKKMFIPSFRVF